MHVDVSGRRKSDKPRKKELTPSMIATPERAKEVASAKAPSGLARIARQQLMSAPDVLLAASGHVLGTLRLDKERLTSLRLLGEYYGLWGSGRLPAGREKPKLEEFKVSEQA